MKPLIPSNGLTFSAPQATEPGGLAAGEDPLQGAWRNILDALPMGVAIYTSDGRIAHCNPRMEAITGYPVAQIQGTAFSLFADPEEFAVAFQQASQGQPWEGPISARSQEGMPRYVEGRAALLPEACGAILVTLQDVGPDSPGGMLGREADRLNAVSTYIRSIDQEVVNTLTLTMASAELLQWSIDPEEPLASCVDNLLQACQRGVDMNRQALHLTQHTAHPIDLTACIRTSLQLMEPEFPSGLLIQSALTSGIWITVVPGVIHSLLASLISQAAQPLGSAETSLHIHLTEVMEREERWALLTVQGPSPSDACPVPDIGLSTARTIVRAHGGQLSWDMGAEGFVYAVRFPCATVSIPRLWSGPSAPDLEGHEQIGLLEPDHLLAKALQTGLESLGYTVTVFPDAAGALGEEAGRRDLWICEQHLPDVQGSDWPESLSLQSRRPVLVIGENDALSRINTFPCLDKPFSLSELARNIRHILDERPSLRGLDSYCSDPALFTSTNNHLRTVLVAEDSRVFRHAIRTWLQEAGYQVLEALDGMEALDTFIRASAAQPVDVVLTDIIMPRMDGLELIRQIRNLDRKVPIAVLTSQEDQQTAKTALQLGVNDFLNKPFQPKLLLDCVAALAATREAPLKAENTAREVRLAHSALMAVQEKDLPVYSVYRPLSDAGGDIFRCFKLSDGAVLFILADIAGHSVVSSYAVASLLGILSTLVKQAETSKPLALALNQAIQNGPFPDIPACALFGHWTPKTGRLHLLNAGLPHGLVRRRESGQSDRIAINGTPLGILPDPLMDERVLYLQPGDRMLFATDGFFDACSTGGAPFDTLAPGIWNTLGDLPVQGALDQICEAVRSHSQGIIADDLLAVGFEQPTLHLEDHGLMAQIPSTPRAIDKICLQLKERLGSSACSPGKRFEIILAAREALTNAMLHGNEGKKDRRILVHAWTQEEPGRFFLRVMDEGEGFDLEHHSAVMDPHSERGRGISIMRHYCSRLEMASGELTLEFAMEDSRDINT